MNRRKTSTNVLVFVLIFEEQSKYHFIFDALSESLSFIERSLPVPYKNHSHHSYPLYNQRPV